jgi:hypothetical protein
MTDCAPVQEALLQAPTAELDALLAEHGHADCPDCTALAARIREQEAALHGAIGSWVAQPPDGAGRSHGTLVRLWPALVLGLAIAATLALVIGSLFAPTPDPSPVPGVEPPRPAVPIPTPMPLPVPEDPQPEEPPPDPPSEHEDTDPAPLPSTTSEPAPRPTERVTQPTPSPRPRPMPTPSPRPRPVPAPSPAPTPR